MQRLPRRIAGIFGSRTIAIATIDQVSTKQMACFGKMDSDLMSSASLQLTFDHGVITDLLDGSNMGYSSLR